jgi:hypothetical protein
MKRSTLNLILFLMVIGIVAFTTACRSRLWCGDRAGTPACDSMIR